MQIESLSIEDLAALRDKVISTLADKVAARQKELLAESERVGALVTSKPSTALKRAVKVLRWCFGMVGLWDNARLGEAEGRYAGELGYKRAGTFTRRCTPYGAGHSHVVCEGSQVPL